ncbi:MAG TPA: hypothetical protein PKD10_16075 [Paracoccaceae bacterium]|nr:hypothetical protein [Paracoccaceae bacterium]HMO73141.1 hypothetical protein [Paracoccaceae bacterium]
MRDTKHDLTFLGLLQTFRQGELLIEGDAKLTELVEAIDRIRGDGELAIKLKFKLNKAGQVEVVPTVTIKKPARALGTGIYFAAEDGRLTRRNPHQADIEDEIERRRALDL